MYMEKILPRRMSTTACSFASHFGQEMAQNADLPISCKNFSGATPPNPRPVLGHKAVLFPDSRCFGSHNFQIVPARLNTYSCWEAIQRH